MKKLLIPSMFSIVLLTTGCLKEKKIPTQQLITIYDSNLKETNKIAPLETMYVKIGGIAPNQLHRIEILDPNGKLISFAEVKSDENGVIGPMPIWYDVGVERKKLNGKWKYSIVSDNLSIKAFYVRVKSLENKDTNFKQNFFLLLKKPNNPNEMPKPVVSAVSVEDGNISNATITNTFFETGSKNPDGSDSNLTKVYVKADRLPYKTKVGDEYKTYDSVDIYVVPFTGGVFENGTDLEEIAITSRKDVKVDDNQTFRTLKPTLIWNLNRDPKLINPGDSNNAYSIIIDTNKNGKFDVGEDLDGNGQYDKYIDGIDGQGVAGFIVMNTEANELNYFVSNSSKEKQNSIFEKESGDKTYLYLNVNNLPTSAETAKIFVIDEDTIDLNDGYDLASNEVRNANEDGSKGTEADITEADNNTTFLPHIDLAKLITTQDVEGYGYTKDITENKKLDIVIDMNSNDTYDKGIDYYIPNAINIVKFDANVTTTADSNGEEITTAFNEANSDTNTTVYIKYGNNATGECVTQRYAYLYKSEAAPNKGDELFGEIIRNPIYTDNNCVSKFIDTTELFNKNILKIINPTSQNNHYTIIIDKNDDHKFNPDDGDVKLDITFKDTSANSLPDVSYINIASGGLMGRPYQHWETRRYTSLYDYRDTFTVNADNTIPTEWWWARYWTQKGVKAVWNPYIRNRGWWWMRKYNTYIDEKGVENPSPLYNHQIVDLYIIDANKYKLYKDMQLKDFMDVRGRHMTLPVQISCRNGYNLQTIWKAPLKVGKYYVIVDVNRNGKIDDGIDLIDAVTKDGVTIKENPNVVGFSVVD
jgi:hypothetical protein